MSCTLCHYITGHDPSCRHYHEDAAQDQAELRTRLEALEQKVERLVDRVTDYEHLKKLYAESRDYVRTLEGERDDLVEANRKLTAQNDRLDGMVDKLRGALIGARGFMLGVAGRPEASADVRTLLNAEAIVLEQLLAEIPHER
jgi:predicted nuclease with TOPRIM domain